MAHNPQTTQYHGVPITDYGAQPVPNSFIYSPEHYKNNDLLDDEQRYNLHKNFAGGLLARTQDDQPLGFQVRPSDNTLEHGFAGATPTYGVGQMNLGMGAPPPAAPQTPMTGGGWAGTMQGSQGADTLGAPPQAMASNQGAMPQIGSGIADGAVQAAQPALPQTPATAVQGTPGYPGGLQFVPTQPSGVYTTGEAGDVVDEPQGGGGSGLDLRTMLDLKYGGLRGQDYTNLSGNAQAEAQAYARLTNPRLNLPMGEGGQAVEDIQNGKGQMRFWDKSRDGLQGKEIDRDQE